MPCLFAAIAVFFPRGALVVMWLVAYTATAFETRLWPLLGFVFLPFTTCAWALAMNEVGAIRGVGLLLIIIGVLLDFATHGGTEYGRRTRVVRVKTY
ncbi:MAG: hypothetical protein ACLFTT_05095 [Candidatus Hydrogenedentota bacterium]